MHYTEHPDYHLYKSQIDQLLKDGFPKKTYARNLVRNHYIEQPKIKLTGQYSIKEREFKDIIGKKKGTAYRYWFHHRWDSLTKAEPNSMSM